MKVIFMGTPQFAVPTLERLLERGHDVVAVLTQPDRPAGRGRKLVGSPVKVVAEREGTPVLQPTTLRDEALLAELRAMEPDVVVVVAYGHLLPPEVLGLFDKREIVSPKGPVFQTAILAGTMAAKKTADLIPLCHPIPIENCHIDIEVEGGRVVIECAVSVHHKTGVEMEALTGASVAALTVYDMCKGVSRDMKVVEIALIEKRGGRSDQNTTRRSG